MPNKYGVSSSSSFESKKCESKKQESQDTTVSVDRRVETSSISPSSLASQAASWAAVDVSFNSSY
jgi:hypothetical protein